MDLNPILACSASFAIGCGLMSYIYSGMIKQYRKWHREDQDEIGECMDLLRKFDRESN